MANRYYQSDEEATAETPSYLDEEGCVVTLGTPIREVPQATSSITRYRPNVEIPDSDTDALSEVLTVEQEVVYPVEHLRVDSPTTGAHIDTNIDGPSQPHTTELVHEQIINQQGQHQETKHHRRRRSLATSQQSPKRQRQNGGSGDDFRANLADDQAYNADCEDLEEDADNRESDEGDIPLDNTRTNSLPDPAAPIESQHQSLDLDLNTRSEDNDTTHAPKLDNNVELA